MQGNIQNRESFLNTISQRLGRTEIKKSVVRPEWKFRPQDEVLKGKSKDELLKVLEVQCQKIHTEFIITEQAQLSNTISELIEKYGRGPIVTWKDSRFEEFGLTNLIQRDGVHIWDWEKGEENIDYANKANIGVTFSDITLAESGTVVLFSDKDKGRTISFLPVNSFVIVPKSTIVPRMTQAAKIMREKEIVPSCINFITGPSNSADIEMNLVVGVHGPVRAAYIIVDDM